MRAMKTITLQIAIDPEQYKQLLSDIAEVVRAAMVEAKAAPIHVDAAIKFDDFEKKVLKTVRRGRLNREL